MRSRTDNIILFFAVLFHTFCSTLAYAQHREIINFSDSSVLKQITASKGVKVSLHTKGTNNALKMSASYAGQAPFIKVQEGTNKWKLSDCQYLSMDITNPGNEDLLVEGRLIGGQWFSCGQIIPAFKTRTLRTYIVRDRYPKQMEKSFPAMNGLPGGWVSMFSSPHPDSMHFFSIVIINPPKNAVIQISNIRKEGSVDTILVKELATYFPFIDELGQFRYKTWPGKTMSLQDLKQSGEKESTDLIQNKLEEWNSYGGWLKGPKLRATGHFRTEKFKEKWWLVDPDGYLFWSHGIGTVDLNGYTTPITDRQHFFTSLPDSNKLNEFYSIETYNPKGYYKDRTVTAFNHYAYNLYRKFGTDWREKAVRLAHVRLRSWGQNTIGGWSSPEIYSKSLTPYTVTLEIRSAPIEGSEGQWGKFPDPYSENLKEEIKKSILDNEKSVSDPYCIGYFVDNELSWGDSSYLAKAVIRSSGAQPAKIAMQEFLKSKYQTIKALNQKWKTSFTDWPDFLRSRQVPEYPLDDFKVFTAAVTNEYFKVIQATLREVMPYKLYLGCRFDFHFYPTEDKRNDWLIKIAAKYCDVVSFNRYRYSAIDLLPSDADKPVMIGEWHIGALDRGMLHYSLKFSESQENRAELYRHYLLSCLKNPYIVGAHWFEYVDEAVTGRFDGENYNTGFLDVCDRPYPEMVEASREIGKTMYLLRAGKK